MTPTEKLRKALHNRSWSEEELAWVLDLPVELTEHLVWELHITPTVALRLEALSDCWTRVTVDGTVLFEQILKAGEARDVKPGREVYIQVGNAGAMKWSINGQPAKALGKTGQLATARVTRASFSKFLQ